MRVSGGTPVYLYGDHLGSASLTTDSAGGVVSQARYAPFGTVRWQSGVMPTDYTFQSQRSEGFGLSDFNARYYDPVLGRFVSADSIVPGAENPQAFNRYSFVLNNPLKFVDLSGHCPQLDNYCHEEEHRYRYWIVFSSDSGVNWEDDERETIQKTVEQIGKKLAQVIGRDISAKEAYFETFGRKMTFNRSNEACDIKNCWGGAQSESLVNVYKTDVDGKLTPRINSADTKKFLTHELGHVFDRRAGRKPSDAVNEQKGPAFSRDVNSTGFASGFGDMQRSYQPYPTEIFADMFLGWVYGQFKNSESGKTLSDYMTANMTDWIDVARGKK